MSRFKLKETTITVRDEKVTVRELTQAERVQWVKAGNEDKFRGPGLLVSLGCVDPKLTEEEANTLPTEVVSTISTAVMKISGFIKEVEKEEKGQKESNAGGDVPVSSQSGVGDPA